jgi:CheY-like chemotaxis protein
MMAPALPPHVLVIDDDPVLRALFHDLLTDEGYRVSSRGVSRDEEPEAIAALAPDLIITDSMGHAGDGLTASLRSLRTDPRLARTPVVVCTGAVRDLDDLDGGVAALGVRVVLKPFAIDHLLAVVASALAGAS